MCQLPPIRFSPRADILTQERTYSRPVRKRPHFGESKAQGALIFGIFASLAQFESALISERVKAGMERARTQGKPLGRPRIPDDIKHKIQRLRSEVPPLSPRAISKLLGIGYGTARRYVKALEK